MGTEAQQPPNDHDEPRAEERLDSWKEIAAYLKRDVRTLYRWEKQEGLPVRRHVHSKRGTVYAYKHELDAWWNNRRPRLEQQEQLKATRWRQALRLAVAVIAVGLVLTGLVLWFGRTDQLTRAEAPVFQTITLEGTRASGYLSSPLLGDLNGDGKKDLVLSAREAREVYVLFGGNLPAGGGELPAAASVVISAGDAGGWSAVQLGDFNGDGISDVLITHRLPEPASFSATGSSYLVWGRRDWPTTLSLPAEADVTLRFDWRTDAALQGCLPPSGGQVDLNHDGIDDILLGAVEYGFEHGPSERSAAGTVFALFGRRAWPPELEIKKAADITILGSRTGEGFGGACSTGDFNGDGQLDLAVFARRDTLWNLLGARGKTYLFLGRKTWPAHLDALTEFDLALEGTHPQDYYGGYSMMLADVDGDGRSDMIVGKSLLESSPDAPAEIHFWLGGPNRRGTFDATGADVVITISEHLGRSDRALAAADVDGDGLQDLLLSDPAEGSVYLLYGRPQWKNRGRLKDYTPVTLFQTEPGTSHWQIGVGDLDGDSLPEVVFTSPEAGSGVREKAGRAWVLKPYMPVRVDVRPDSTPNVLLLPPALAAVRIYGFSRADEDQINPESVRLRGAAPLRHVWRDANRDGLLDLEVHFQTAEMNLASDTKRVTLTARTRSGLMVAGADSVVIYRSGDAPADEASVPR